MPPPLQEDPIISSYVINKVFGHGMPCKYGTRAWCQAHNTVAQTKYVHYELMKFHVMPGFNIFSFDICTKHNILQVVRLSIVHRFLTWFSSMKDFLFLFVLFGVRGWESRKWLKLTMKILWANWKKFACCASQIESIRYIVPFWTVT